MCSPPALRSSARAFVERQRHDPRAMTRAADLDLDLRAGRGRLLLQQGGGDVLAADRRRGCPAAHLTDSFAAQEHGITRARRRLAVHDETDDALVIIRFALGLESRF